MRKRWSGLFPFGRPSVFIRFLLSYLLVLLIPIVIGANEYSQTKKELIAEAAEQNAQMLTASREMADRLFLEVKDAVSALSVDSDVLSLIQSVSDEPNAEDLYRFSLMRGHLYRFTSLNKLFYDIHIYLGGSRSVVTSRSFFDLRENELRVGELSYGDWVRDAAQRDRLERFYSVEAAAFGGEPRPLIAYVSPLPAGYLGEVAGAVVIWIGQDNVAGLFRQSVEKTGGIAYIADSRGQILAPALADKQVAARLVDIPAAADAGASFRDVDGRQMLVSYSRSPHTGWTFIAALPESVVLAKAENIKRMVADMTLVTLALGLTAAVVLAYRSSKPLGELLDTMKEFVSREQRGSTSIYKVMQVTLREMIHDHLALRSRMEEQQPMIRSALLEGLLKGDYATEEAAAAALRQAKVPLQRDRCFAIVARIVPAAAMNAAAEGKYGGEAHLLEALRRVLEGFDCLLSARGGRAAALVTVDSRCAEEQLERLRQRFEEQRASFSGEGGAAAAIGIGRLAEGLHEAWRSHNEALQALNEQAVGEGGHVVWYGQTAHAPGYYYYPLAIEQKLMHTVKAGDAEGLEQLIRDIEKRNFEDRRLSASAIQLLTAELEGTVHKLLEQLEYGADSQRTLSAEIADLLSREGEPRLAGAKSALRTICFYMREEKMNKASRIADELMRIVHDRYRDPGFGLTALASHFQWSESMASVFFKERAGENFSDYVERLRMEHACEQLRHTGKSIAEIAIESGYSSDKTFRRAFKRFTGVQPTSYRSMPSPQSPG